MQSKSCQAGASRFITRPSKILFSLHDLGASRWTSVFLDASISSAPLFREKITSPIAYYLAEIEHALPVLNKLAGSELAPLLLDLKFWLPNDLLVKVDRMTMAHSVEARAPYLEPDLVSLALNLPKYKKINNRTGKLVLRKFMESKFPGEMGHKLAWRRKHGFSTPISNWLTGPLKNLGRDMLSETRLSQQGLFNPGYIGEVWKTMLSTGGRGVDLRRVWLLLCFQTWYDWHEKHFGFKPV